MSESEFDIPRCQTVEREKPQKPKSPRRSPVTHGPTLGPSGTDQQCAGVYPTRPTSLQLSLYAITSTKNTNHDPTGHSAVSLHMLCHHARGYAKKRFHTVQELSGWVIQHIHRFARDLHAWAKYRYMHTMANCLERKMSGQCTALSLPCARLPQTNCAMDPASRNDARPLCSNP